MLDIEHRKNNVGSGSNQVTLAQKVMIDGGFSLSLADEFRAPLGTMLGMLDLLLTTAMSLKQKEYLEVACSSGRSLMRLIDSVLTFSEIQTGDVEIVEQDCHLLEVLDEVVGLLADKALKKSINLGYVLPEDFPEVVITDPRKLQQILIQLLDNAIKFTHFGEVSIYVERCSPADCLIKDIEMICFIIKDEGIGIAEENFPHVFEPFFQMDPPSEKIYPGLGLGLTIAQKLVELLKGQLEVSSVLGSGSQFTVKLPVKTVAVRNSIDKEAECFNQNFLLVTRSSVIRDYVVNNIQSQGGVVTVCESGQDAVKRFSESDATNFNSIIVDEDLGDIPLADFFGLLQDCPNFTDTFALILSNPYFSSYHLDDLEIARLEKPIVSSSLSQVLVNQTTAEINLQPIATPVNLNSGNQINVLVVEDSRMNQQVIEAMLNRLNCRHQVTSNGKLGVEKVVYGDFDLVLMDCNMPVLSGYAATRQIRGFEEQDAGKLPIIGMATNNTIADRDLCMASGMSDFIGKPLSLVLLRDLLNKWTLFSSKKAITDVCDMDSNKYQLVVNRPSANNRSYNPQALSRLVSIVGSSIKQVIKDFCLDIDIYIENLRSAINQKNESEISYIAHTMKGAARNFGADQVVRLSSQLEEKIRRGELEGSQKILLRLETAAEALTADLSKETESICQQRGNANYFESKDLVLVVDDDRTSRVVLAEALRNSGCEVDEARDGMEALELCRRCMPDLILMDAIMPGLDGFDLCQTIRNMPFGGDIPILIITASDSEDAVSMAFSVAATDFINKPVNTSVIQKRVNHLIASKKAERYMKQLAYHDSLTDLPNRTNLMQHLQLMIDQSKVEDTMFAVLFMDLDHFKAVNDTMGHDVGDLLLKAVSDRLRSYLRGQDFIARLGGDEFTIVLQNIKNMQAVREIADQLCESLKEPFVFLQRKIMVTASIGVSVFPKDGEEISDLLKHADSAMFKAKNQRDRFCFYEEGMETEVSRRLQLQSDLRKAFDQDELILLYQPKMDFKSGGLLGAEALLRWQHPTRGLLEPNEFIEVAEGCDLMPMINNWVLQTGVSQLCSWLQSGYQLTLSLNISLSGSTLEALYEKVLSMIQLYPATKGLIELEITENALMCETEIIGKELIKIRELGVSIALDDFGSGYSSLNHLKEIPVDVLKIDRLFISGIETNSNDQAIVKSIINLADELQIQTVAEGVETDAQKAILGKLNCDCFQGYLASEPLDSDDFLEQFLKPKAIKENKAVRVSAAHSLS